MEIKSTLWQKLFILPISLLIFGVGVGACLVPFVPALHTTSRTHQVTPLSAADVVMAIAVGLFMMVFGCSLLWVVLRYSIRADAEGIRQTNGFFHQSVRWSDVAAYFMEPNGRYYNQRRLHVEPVLLNAEGKVLFHGFAHLLISTPAIVEQRKKLWRFVESQLHGKKIDAPTTELDPNVLALKSLEVNWSEKGLLWKVGRMAGIVCYALFWLAVAMLPTYYMLINNMTIPKPWSAFVVLPMFFGPLLPHIIWLQVKKRKIIRERAMREATRGSS